jgi:hypothetical protein
MTKLSQSRVFDSVVFPLPGRRCATALGVAAALVLVSATTATAAAWRVRHVPARFGGPTLLGDQVSWIARRRDQGGDLYVARAGQTPRRVQTFPADFTPAAGTRVFYGFDLAGSRSSVVLLRARGCVGQNPCSDQAEVYTGAPGSSLGRTEQCEGSISGIDVSGHLAAFPGCDHRLIVRDLRGIKPDRMLGKLVSAAQIAGRYVAWLQPHGPSHAAEAVVYDLAAGKVSYVLRGVHFEAQHGSLALQRDGKIAFTFDPNPNDLRVRSVVAWASPLQPHPHRLGLPGRLFYSVRMAGNHIAFIRARPDPSSSRAEVGVTNLQSHAQLLTHRAAATSAIDFNGKLVAYVAKLPHRTEIRTRSIG